MIGTNCLLFADDIVQIGSSETDLQALLNRCNTEIIISNLCVRSITILYSKYDFKVIPFY